MKTRLFPALFFAVTGCIISDTANAQTQGPFNGNNFVNDNGVGTNQWSDMGNAQTSDDVYATVDISGCSLAASNYLKVTNFNFSIPGTAVIEGIKVEIEMSKGSGASAICAVSGTGIAHDMEDAVVSLVKGGTVSGANLALHTPLAARDEYRTYGDCNTLWTNTWTPSDINASSFGVVIAFENELEAGPAIVNIDHVLITVCYSTANGLDKFSGSDIQVTVYPNPTSGQFRISGSKLNFTSLDIYNVFGEKVHHSTISNPESQTIDPNLPNGIYFLDIKTNTSVGSVPGLPQKLVVFR